MTKQSGRPTPHRLLRPTNDTDRIAGELGSFPTSLRAPSSPRREAETRVISAQAVEQAIADRALRSAHLPPDLLGESAWDMLLELLHAELTGRRITPAILSKAAAVQTGTGLRWIEALMKKGLCVRSSADPERGEIRLSSEGSRAMHAYFAALGGA